MANLLQHLPGLDLPVSEVPGFLKDLWFSGSGQAGVAQFRASQLNLVLHFGLHTDLQEANEVFQTALAFAERYPARIVVLCPQEKQSTGTVMRAKVYTQCFIGESGREKSCSEVLMLGYQPGDQGFLENQVSIWIESDLPLYHWFHRVPAVRIETQYLPFTRKCQRVLFDQSVESDDLSTLKWPEGVLISDLASARMLPVRQSLGQFLSAYPPALLVEGLERVILRARPGLEAECQHLQAWMESALKLCSQSPGGPGEGRSWEFVRETVSEDLSFAAEWIYRGGESYFRWTLQKDRHHGLIECRWRGEKRHFPVRIKKLLTNEVLAEAIFFS